MLWPLFKRSLHNSLSYGFFSSLFFLHITFIYIAVSKVLGFAPMAFVMVIFLGNVAFINNVASRHKIRFDAFGEGQKGEGCLYLIFISYIYRLYIYIYIYIKKTTSISVFKTKARWGGGKRIARWGREEANIQLCFVINGRDYYIFCNNNNKKHRILAKKSCFSVNKMREGGGGKSFPSSTTLIIQFTQSKCGAVTSYVTG